MTTIRLKTIIDAPVEVCFRVSLTIDLMLWPAEEYAIQAIGGVTTGTIGLGERVTWRTRQFGIPVTHTSEITALAAPAYFQDSMVHSIFRSFCHDHFFTASDRNRTEMRDELSFSMPTLLLGEIAERMVVKRRLTALLQMRNARIKQVAERETAAGS
jgi:ligand-binding SRPBCC domain-containing protein